MTFSASKTAPPHVGQASPSSPLQNEHLQTSSSSSSFNDIIMLIKLYGGRIRKECRWGRLDSGCMAGPKKTYFSKHKHYETPQIKQLQTAAQTCNVGPHCACEPCQGPKVFHMSNICDKPCGSGVNLEIFTQLKGMLFNWLLMGSDPMRFWIKAHLKFTAWVWYKVIEVPSRSWQERQMEQNS